MASVPADADDALGSLSADTLQAQFDRWFPRGVYVHVVQDVPEEADDDVPTFVCPRIVVFDDREEIEAVGDEFDPAHPWIRIVNPGVKSSVARVDSIEDYASDDEHYDLLMTMVEGGQQYRLSSFLEPEAEHAAMLERTLNARYRLAPP